MRHFNSQEQENKFYTVFLELKAADDNVGVREHGNKQQIPEYLLQIIMAMYQGGLCILADGDNTSGKVAPNKGVMLRDARTFLLMVSASARPAPPPQKPPASKEHV
eukprot:165160-Pelagomonas_calceolata.AAC.1